MRTYLVTLFRHCPDIIAILKQRLYGKPLGDLLFLVKCDRKTAHVLTQANVVRSVEETSR